MLVKKRVKIATVTSLSMVGLMVANPVYANPDESPADTGLSVEVGKDSEEETSASIQSPEQGETPEQDEEKDRGLFDILFPDPDEDEEEPNEGEEGQGEEPEEGEDPNEGEEPTEPEPLPEDPENPDLPLPGLPGDGDEDEDNGDEDGDQDGSEEDEQNRPEEGNNDGSEEDGSENDDSNNTEEDELVTVPEPTDPPAEEKPESISYLHNAKDQQQQQEQNGDKGGKLPDTSSSHPMQMAVGLLTAVSGAALLFFRRLRSQS